MTDTTTPSAATPGASGAGPFPVPEFQADPERACDYNPPAATIPGGGCLHTGISLRDHFAGQVVAGIVANSEAVHAGAEPTLSCLAANDGRASAWIACHAYAIADAMLAERQRPIRPGAALARTTEQGADDAR